MPAILWPDVEAALINYLSPALAASPLSFAGDIFVGNLLPNPRPDYAVTVRNDGGPGALTVFADLRIGINVWALTKADAVDLAAYVVAYLNGAPESAAAPFSNVTASVAYEVPDDSGQPHLYLTATLRVRGTTL